MNARTLALVAFAALVAALAVWWQRSASPVPPVSAPADVASAPAHPASAPASAPQQQPVVKYPVEPVDPSAALTPEAIQPALVDLLGGKAVATFLQTDAFPRRLAATVDALGRAHAPSGMWPVLPAPGRFTVQETAAGPVTAEENSTRYTPFILLAETVDLAQVVKLYTRMYPLLQQAYRELGYPEGQLNDRTVEVLDLLLATPEVEYPLALQLVEVKGPYASERPWVRWQFADPALEQLAAGQKILLRIGPVNQRRLKNRLAELREQLTRRPAAR